MHKYLYDQSIEFIFNLSHLHTLNNVISLPFIRHILENHSTTIRHPCNGYLVGNEKRNNRGHSYEKYLIILINIGRSIKYLLTF